MGTEFTPAIVITALLCLAVFTLFIYQFTIIVKKIRLSKTYRYYDKNDKCRKEYKHDDFNAFVI